MNARMLRAVVIIFLMITLATVGVTTDTTTRKATNETAMLARAAQGHRDSRSPMWSLVSDVRALHSNTGSLLHQTPSARYISWRHALFAQWRRSVWTHARFIGWRLASRGITTSWSHFGLWLLLPSQQSQLVCVRNVESRDHYWGAPIWSTAAGAYQFIQSTWHSIALAGLPSWPNQASTRQQDAAASWYVLRNGGLAPTWQDGCGP